MSGTKKTWVSILIAGLIICVVLGVAIIGSGAYFVYRHVNARFTSNESAEAELASVAGRFAGQEPLIEIKDDEEPIIHRPPAAAPMPNQLQSLNAVVFDPRSHKIVHFNMPMWLLRLTPSRHVLFPGNGGDIGVDSERMHLSLEDLERRGPGLVLDHQDPRGVRVIVWTE